MGNVFDRIVEFIEKDRFSLPVIFLYVFLVGLLRRFIEQAFLHQKISTNLDTYFTMGFFQVSMLLGGGLILSYINREKMRKTMNAAVFIMWIVIIAPLLDALVFNTESSAYKSLRLDLPLGDFLMQFFTLGHSVGEATGVILMFLVLISFASAYVFIKTKSKKKAISCFALFYLFGFFLGGEGYALFLPANYITLYSGMRQLIVSIVFSILIFYWINKNILITLLKGTKPLKNLYFVLLVAAGILIGGNDYLWPFSLSDILVRLFIITFVWQFTLIINNVFDEKIDNIQKNRTPVTEGALSRRTYLELGVISALLAIIMSIILKNFMITALTIISLVSAVLYSVPPFRLRNRLFSTSFIGIVSVTSFLIGYLGKGESPLIPYNSPIISIEIIYLLVVLFFAVTMGTNVKDLKDIEGDKESGVRTLFTVFGHEKGKDITSVLVLISFLLPILLFSGLVDIVFFVTLALVIVFVFRRFEKYQLVIGASFLVFAYCTLKLMGIPF